MLVCNTRTSSSSSKRYRWYDAQGVEPLFPFGHGLSYTSFGYANANAFPVSDGTAAAAATSSASGDEGGVGVGDAAAWLVSLDVTNTGKVVGSEVVQLYLAFPESAGEPPQQLKGIAKVGPLNPGETATAVFQLPKRAFSVWDVEVHEWSAVAGGFTVGVGASSRDIRHTEAIDVAWG
jgi:beta-glucosidase